MAKLKSRQMQVPGGFHFSLPELSWTAPAFASFDTIVNQVQQLIQSNPEIAAKNGWPTSRVAIENWVDSYNATVCEMNGWTQYILEGGGGSDPPKTVPPNRKLASVAGAVRKAGSGAAVLLEWEKSGLPPVAPEVAASRAAVCAACPKNGSARLTDWFTVPLSEYIRKQLGRLNEMKLATPSDDKLGTCEVCLCPLPLKVWCPSELVQKHLSAEVKAGLPAHCWIVNEAKS